CDHHHDLKTLEKWALVPGPGRRPMVAPDHPNHPDHPNRTARPAPSPAPAGPRSAGGNARITELAERLERLRRKDAEWRARQAGQDQLFDTG
ncbi:MAG TPA: hypothetical protein PLS46_17400, partial [Microthrixaceae bacterium]|nr:hypothetical protein [Microthrixaceae bacterium]